MLQGHHAKPKRAAFDLLDKHPTAIGPETLDSIKGVQTIKEDATVYLAGEKEGAHLSRPDRRGEHAFSNFIRQVATDDGNPAHAAGGQGRGCKVAALRGEALAPSARH